MNAWEKRKLSDYAVYRRGSFPQPYGNKEWYNGSLSMPFVQVVDVSSNLRLNESTKQRISQQAQPMSVFVPAHSIVVTLQGSIGRVAITQYDAYVDRTLLIFERFLHPTDKVFFAYVLQKKFSEEKDKAPGGTIKTITKEALSSFEVLTPIISEQHEIGSLLKNLDNLIAATQHKIDALEQAKKALLQRLFDQSWRFKGYSDPWEKRKLGEISPLRGGFAFKSSEFKDKGIPIIRISNIKSDGKVGGDFVYYHEQEVDQSYLLPQRAALLAMSGATTGKVAILHKQHEGKYYQNQRVGYFSKVKDASYSFISVLIRSDLFLKQLKSVLVAGAQPNVSSKEIDQFIFSVPVTLNEQEKIGAFFEYLDSLIAATQSRLFSLELLKKSLLQDLFI
ncbi:restriction endonuclease subunit S [Lacticaseibacillus paracasei]|uniref:restriction endonuclease subunit S n=1 Tax=Lacticaseibacillus paracasei TaxID=1597 RepID=UPI0022DF1040|nr:restriction endonuclease subunit S [Lacticaseibacillus paracasei]